MANPLKILSINDNEQPLDRCLVCNKLTEIEGSYHPGCHNYLFGFDMPEVLEYPIEEIEALAKKEVNHKIITSGVQPKLSLGLTSQKHGKKLTLFHSENGFILKPPMPGMERLPLVEAVSMQLADIVGLQTAPHGLILLGTKKKNAYKLAYICRRFDRSLTPARADKKKTLEYPKKFYAEDLCQLSERLTENKYKGSMEQVGKLIYKHTTEKGHEMLSLWEIIVFSFLIGNADLHLKNISVIRDYNSQSQKFDRLRLSPCYDLLNTVLVNPEDDEEMALTINGKKKKLLWQDFLSLATSYKIPEKVCRKSLEKFETRLPELTKRIQNSFLSPTDQADYINLLKSRFGRLIKSI